jgi:cysteine desulfurase/selenocysteine lyase
LGGAWGGTGGHGGGHYGISGSALARLGFTTTPEQIDRFVEELIGAIGFLREQT